MKASEYWATYNNFDLDESAAGYDNNPGSGYAQVYLNNSQVAKMFGEECIFEEDQKEGDVVRIGFMTDDNKAYTHEGSVIAPVFIAQWAIL